MKILLISIGTRGDMEPFLAIAELLKNHGNEVVCLFPEQFRSLAEESGFRFTSLGTEFIELLESDVGKAAMGGSSSTLKKIKAYRQLAMLYSEISRNIVQQQYEIVAQEKPDKIVHHAKAIYPLLWGLEHPGKTILVSPVPYVLHEVKTHSHIAFNRNFGSFLNKATYTLARFGLAKTVVKAARRLKPAKKIHPSQIKNALLQIKTIYTISPSVFSRPAYWPEQVKVLGYHERNKTLQWRPNRQLLDFISRHQKFLLVTFGSMRNPHPAEKTAIILKVLEKYEIPALINTAGGGLVAPKQYNSSLHHFVSRIPYDYILPQTYAIVHHGGSGTTHMALKYGCASMIIPHIIDQFLWNNLLYKKGVGPKGPSITALKEQTLGAKLLELWNNYSYKATARQIADQMTREDFGELLYETIIR